MHCSYFILHISIKHLTMSLNRYELENIIPKYVTNKDVLDVGCLCHDLRQFEANGLHKVIKKHARSLKGIDIEPEAYKLKKLGYDVVVMDFFKYHTSKRFDIIVAGEFIEHISNFEAFCIQCHRLLKDNGKVFVTTPNPYYWYKNLDILIRGEPRVFEHHTTYFCPKTLKLAFEKNGFKVIDWGFLNEAKPMSIGYIPIRIRKWWSSNFWMLVKC